MSHAPQLSADDQPIRILVVDDEAAIRHALVELLQLEGYWVQTATSGEEALKALEASPYQAIILDLQMPGIQGDEVMSVAHQRWPELSIIVLTGQATVETAIAAVDAQAVAYLRKPAGLQDIVAAIHRATQAQREQRQRRLVQKIIGDMSEVLRSTDPASGPPPAPEPRSDRVLCAHPLTLDRAQNTVVNASTPDTPIRLTHAETDILASLMEHPNQALTCRQIAQSAWGKRLSELDAQSIVRPHILRLRRKLEDDPEHPMLICTQYGLGYVLITTGKR